MRWRVALVVFVAVLSSIAELAAQSGFPYNRDLVFEGRPMRGSKRVPILTFAEDGAMQIDLWCKRGEGKASMTEGVLKITVGTMTDEAGCSAERLAADEDMLAALDAVTSIRLDGDVVTLVGPKPLRFRAATN